MQAACQLYPELSNYGRPARTADAQLSSLVFQLGRRNTAKAPHLHVMERAYQAVRTAYGDIYRPIPEELLRLNPNLVMQRIEYHLQLLKTTAHPGEPWSKLGSTIGKIVDEHRELLVQSAYDRIYALAFEQDIASLSAEQLVERGLCDPVRVFIKNEPHPIEKIHQGRFRLIMNISVCDQLVARVFNSEMNEDEINAVASGLPIPVVAGNGLDTEQQIEQLLSHVSKWNTQYVDTDVSAWDFSVPDWLLDMDTRFRLDVLRAYNTLFGKVLSGVAFCQSKAVLVLSDGTLYAQARRGIVKSGSVNTTSGNSRMRAILARLCGSTASFSMGDDTIELTELSQQEFTAKYAEYGFRVTDYHPHQPQTYGFEFCSKIISYDNGVGHALPLSAYKSLWSTIYSHEPLEARLFALYETLRRHPDVKQLVALASWVCAGEK